MIEETISTVERENSRPKTSQNLRQILCILHQLICGPGPVLPHQFERTQCPNQSNIAEASNSLAPAPVMHPQDSDFDLFFSLLNDDNHYSAGLTPSFLYASSSPGDMSTVCLLLKLLFSIYFPPKTSRLSHKICNGLCTKF